MTTFTVEIHEDIVALLKKGARPEIDPGSAIGTRTRRQTMAEEHTRYAYCRNGNMHDRGVVPSFTLAPDCVLGIVTLIPSRATFAVPHHAEIHLLK